MHLPGDRVVAPGADHVVAGDVVPVTEDAVAAYRAALGLPVDPVGVAPPLYPTVVSWAPMLAVVHQVLIEADLPAGVVLTRHTAELVRPLQVGERATATAWAARRAGIPQGTLLEVAHDTSVDGELVAAQRTVLLLVGRGGTPEDRELVREAHRVAPGEETSVRLAVPADLPARYAAASGDDNPIHVDDAAARAAGLPGIVVHGMAILALAIAAAQPVCCGEGSPRRTVVGIGAQLGRPVLPGDELTVGMWPDPTDPLRCGLRAATVAGPSLKRGWLRYRS